MSSEFVWGTIYNQSPLAVRLDGETSPIGVTPDALVDKSLLREGDRVRCEFDGRRVIIWGVAGGLLERNKSPLPRGVIRSFHVDPANAPGGTPAIIHWIEFQADSTRYYQYLAFLAGQGGSEFSNITFAIQSPQVSVSTFNNSLFQESPNSSLNFALPYLGWTGPGDVPDGTVRLNFEVSAQEAFTTSDLRFYLTDMGGI